MRELAEEGRKAREAQAASRAPAAPPPDPTNGPRPADVYDEAEAYPWPYVFQPTPPVHGPGQYDLCHHGREMRDPCHECGRR